VSADLCGTCRRAVLPTGVDEVEAAIRTLRMRAEDGEPRAPRLPTYGPKMDAATLYVRLIQNPVKRAYAAAYALHLAGIEPVPEKPADLSYMAAQAVRLRLTALAADSYIEAAHERATA